MNGPTEHCVALPGLRMHYLATGPVGGPPVILLHGFPEAAYVWRGQWKRLADAGYRVIAPDQRGFNLTDKAPPYDLETVVNDVLALMDALSFPRVCLVGHNWGALVAWTLAGVHPSRIEKLVIFNVPHPAVMLGIVHNLDIRQWLRSWYGLVFLLPVVPEALLGFANFMLLRGILRGTARRGAFSELDLDYYQRAWSQPRALSAMLGWYRALPRVIFSPFKRRRLNVRIQAPTLVCWGMRDFVLRPGLAEQSMAWVDNGKLIRFQDGSHWLPEEFQTEAADLILQHFDQDVPRNSRV